MSVWQATVSHGMIRQGKDCQALLCYALALILGLCKNRACLVGCIRGSTARAGSILGEDNSYSHGQGQANVLQTDPCQFGDLSLWHTWP